MRILFVTASLPFGLGETFIVPEINELRRRGHEIRILPVNPKGRPLSAESAALEPLAIHSPSTRVAFNAAKSVVRTPSLLLSATPALSGKDLRTRIVNVASAACAAAALATVRKWNPDHIHAHWATHPATTALLLSDALGVPWSLTTHRYDLVRDNLLALKMRSAVFTRFISESTLAIAAQHLVGLPQSRYGVIRLGVDLPNEVSQQQPVSRIVLCPARLLPVKGHSFLLQAFAEVVRQVPDAELWLAGDGPLERTLRSEVGALRIASCVKFLGHVAHDVLLGWYRGGRLAAVVLSSLDLGGNLHEGIPVALVEAMGYGVPVVGTATGGIPELLSGAAGILVPPASPPAIASALTTLLTDSSAHHATASAGRAAAIRDHSVKNVITALEMRALVRGEADNGRAS